MNTWNPLDVVYWVVCFRWVIHWGEPARVIVLRSCDETQMKRFDSAHVFTSHKEGIAKADSYRCQRWNGETQTTPSGIGVAISESDPRFVWPPNLG